MNFIENETEQKLRGGYYTPPDLAKFISSWILEARPVNLLEPSCGDGVFLRSVAGASPNWKVSLTAFEILESEAAKARKNSRLSPNVRTKVHSEDFLSWSIPLIAAGEAKFDAVVGNPPFIRYQYLPEESQARAEAIFRLMHLPFTKHTNAWVPFVLASIALLRPGGRLGMVLPAEIVHVTHASSLRSYLAAVCSNVLIVDPEEIWFEGTLQGAVIVFAEKKVNSRQESQGLGITRVTGREFATMNSDRLYKTAEWVKGDALVGKWTKALLSGKERELLEETAARHQVFRFDEIAKVDVGIVTGANKFFLVTDEVVKKYSLERFAHPMFGRSEHCPGVIYDQRQHKSNAEAGFPTNFLWLSKDEKNLSGGLKKYVELGESEGLHKRYKCRIRSPWYTVPSVYASRIGMLKRAHDTPRLVLNRKGAFTTDTAYRIRAKGVNEDRLVYCFINSLTALSANLEGRHYGGGVLELVPSEIERLLVPLPDKVKPDLVVLDRRVREMSVADILIEQDRIVLGAVGLSRSEIEVLFEAWQRLRRRRQRIGVLDAQSISIVNSGGDESLR